MDKVVLVLGQARHDTLDHDWLGWRMRQCVSGDVLGMPHLVCEVPALGQRAADVDG